MLHARCLRLPIANNRLHGIGMSAQMSTMNEDIGIARAPAQVEEVLINLRRVVRAIDLHSRQLVRHHGLTVPQLMVLREITRHTEPSVAEIAQGISLSKPTVTSILDRLERHGWIQRARSPRDRRRVILTLTSTGRDLLRAAPPLLHDRFVASFTTLKDWEQTLILSSLQRVVDMMNASEFDAAPILSPGPVAPAPTFETPAPKHRKT